MRKNKQNIPATTSNNFRTREKTEVNLIILKNILLYK